MNLASGYFRGSEEKQAARNRHVVLKEEGFL